MLSWYPWRYNDVPLLDSVVGGEPGSENFSKIMEFQSLSPSLKRARESETPVASTTGVPSFLLVNGTEGDALKKASPFLIDKSIRGIAGTVRSIKKLASGSLLIETASDIQSNILLKTTMLDTIKVSVEAHRTLNFCKGVITSSDLREVSENVITKELESQNVVETKRITTRREGVLQPTNSIILTFSGSKLPDHVTAGYLRLKVRPYIPNPLRCFKCQRFGHSQNICKSKTLCHLCGHEHPQTEQCAASPKCVNCGGAHPASSRDCPKWSEEKKIQELRVVNRLSFGDARRLYKQQNPSNLPSTFAQVVASQRPTRSIAVQTDEAECACLSSRVTKHNASAIGNVAVQTPVLFSVSSNLNKPSKGNSSKKDHEVRKSRNLPRQSQGSTASGAHISQTRREKSPISPPCRGRSPGGGRPALFDDMVVDDQMDNPPSSISTVGGKVILNPKPTRHRSK